MSTYRDSMLGAARRIVEAQTDNIVELVRMAGLDPRKAFRGGSWRQCDFQHRDLRRFDFTDADLTGAKFEGALIAGAVFTGAIGVNLKKANVDIGADVRLDARHYNALIRGAKTLGLALQVLEDMLRAGVRADRNTFVALIAKVGRYGQGEEVCRRLRNAGVEPTHEVCLRMIDLAATQAQVADWGAQLLALEDGVPAHAYNRLVKRTDSYDAALQIVETMRRKGIQANPYTFNLLVEKAPDFQAALSLADLSKGVTPEPVILTTLMKRAPTVEAADELFRKIKRARPHQLRVAYNTLMTRSNGLTQATRYLDEMRSEGLEPDGVTLNILLTKQSGFDGVIRYLNQLTARGFSPDAHSFDILFRKCRDSADVGFVARTMVAMKVALSPENFSTALRKLKLGKASSDRVGAQSKKATLAHRLAMAIALSDLEFKLAVRTACMLLSVDNTSFDYSEGALIALASRVETMADAEVLAAGIEAGGLYVSERTYGPLYWALTRGSKAEEIFRFHFQRKKKAWPALRRAIAGFVAHNRNGEALRIALAFPDVPEARSAMARHPRLAERVFRRFENSEPFNFTHAMAYLSLARRRPNEALELFERALELNQLEARRPEIERQITRLRAQST